MGTASQAPRRPTTRRRPVIGISAYNEPARWGVWHLPAVLVPSGYVDAVHRAGGQPLLLPPAPGTDDLLDLLDGLLLSGGADIAPERYGEPPHSETTGTRADRDASELAMTQAALREGLPLLGVCRGMQMLNVASGGTLEQHLPDRVEHDGHRERPGVFGEHRVRTGERTRLRGVVGSAVTVRSYHHQGVGKVGEPLRVAAHADDGTVEALEHPELPFAIGVLWHPEVGDDDRLFEALVAQAAQRRDKHDMGAKSDRHAVGI